MKKEVFVRLLIILLLLSVSGSAIITKVKADDLRKTELHFYFPFSDEEITTKTVGIGQPFTIGGFLVDCDASCTGIPNKEISLFQGGTFLSKTMTSDGVFPNAGTYLWSYYSNVPKTYTFQTIFAGDAVYASSQSQTLTVIVTDGIPPEVAGMMPSDGFAEYGEQTYTVEGSGFQSGATVFLEKPDADPIPGTDVEFNSESVLFVNFSFTTDNVGLYDVVVRNPDGSVGRLNEGFRVRPVPVVLVHGWRGAPSMWNDLKADLLTKGYSESDILVFNYEQGLEEPIGYANNLAAEISNWRAHNDDYDGKIDIICHSYGAIVSRWYMQELKDSEGKQNGEKVRLWLGLAPVNQGAAIADIQPAITPLVWLNRLFNVHFFGIEPAITHMKTNSATVKTLKDSYPIPGVTYKVIVGYNAATTPEQRAKYSSLGGYTLEKKANGLYRFTQLGDGVVANAQSALPNAGIDYFPGLTHTNIYKDESVHAKVILYLKNPSESSSNTVPTITNERDQNLIPMLSSENHGNFAGGWMYPIKVDSSVSNIVIYAAGDMTSPNTKLYNPDGIQVTSGLNTDIAVNEIGEYYDILSPQTGSWQLQSYGTTDTFDRLVFIDSPIWLDSSEVIEDISLGHTVTIASTLNQNEATNLRILQSGNTGGVPGGEATLSGASVGWNVTAMIQLPDMTTIQLALYDDGLHSDGSANDGKYANVYTPSRLGLYSVETIAQSITDPMLERSTLASFSVTGPDIAQIPGQAGMPTDPDNDGIYEDLNGNGRLDFADVVLYFNQMEWIAANEPVSAFDLNGNGRIDFADIVRLFGEI